MDVKESVVEENVTVDEEVTEGPTPRDPREEFMEEAGNVAVPLSVGMNTLREGINNLISSSPLHIECILEEFRAACSALEKHAAENAEREANEYYSKINELRQKYNITD